MTAPPEVVTAWQNSTPLRVEFPDLLELDWKQSDTGFEAQRGQLTILSDAHGLTFTHAKHGRIKQVPP